MCGQALVAPQLVGYTRRVELPATSDVFEGRYRLDAVLGAGGFATVYDAVDLENGRRVAVKVLRPDERTQQYPHDVRARFRREVEIIGQLRSPRTVVMFDAGAAANGLLYMVFEHVPGEDLDEILKRRERLELMEAVEIGIQVLDSLGEAHALGLLHRDLKPSNVRVTTGTDGRPQVKLLDFGLARAMGTHTAGGVTQTGEIVGTPRYMAPEQLMATDLTPAADLYSLGMMLFEMLFGEAALYGVTWGEQIERLRTGHLFSVPEMERVGTPIVALLQALTAREAAERPQHAGFVRDELMRLTGRPPTGTRPVAQRPSPNVWAERSAEIETDDEDPNLPTSIIVVGALAIAVIAGAIALVVLQPRTEQPVRRTHIPMPQPTAQKPEPAQIPPDIGLDAEAPDVARSADAAQQSHRSAGCGLDAVLTKWPEGFDTIRAARWNLRVVLPQPYDQDRAYPMVVVLHQANSSAEQIVRLGKFDKLARRDGAIVVAPQDNNPIMTWAALQTPTPRGKEDVTRQAEAAMDQLCVDTRRVYVLGNGQGGKLASYMACEPWVRGLATTSFRDEQGHGYCRPDDGLPHVMLAPLKSPREPVDGGPSCGIGPMWMNIRMLSLEATQAEWKEHNRCTGNGRKTKIKDGSVCYDFDCETPFRSCHINAGHGFPGAPQRPADGARCDGKPPKYPIGELMWDFLMKLPPNDAAPTP